MNIGTILKLGGIAVFTCFLACEQVPKNSIDDARTALAMAEKSGGQSWAPEQLEKGHVFFDSAMKELSIEKKKLPFKRNYSKAIDLFDLASEAGHFTMETMQTARSNCQALLTMANAMADSTENKLKAAAAKNIQVGHLQAALDSARIAQKDALSLLDSTNLHFAQEKATAAFDKTEAVLNSASAFLASHK